LHTYVHRGEYAWVVSIVFVVCNRQKK